MISAEEITASRPITNRVLSGILAQREVAVLVTAIAGAGCAKNVTNTPNGVN